MKYTGPRLDGTYAALFHLNHLASFVTHITMFNDLPMAFRSMLCNLGMYLVQKVV